MLNFYTFLVHWKDWIYKKDMSKSPFSWSCCLCNHSGVGQSVTLSHQLEYLAFGYERAGGGKVKFWGSRKKPGVMDFLPKLMGDEILGPFYLTCDPEGWFLLEQLLDVSLALSVLSRHHAFKILVFKSDPATRANISSFLVLRLNSNTALRQQKCGGKTFLLTKAIFENLGLILLF